MIPVYKNKKSFFLISVLRNVYQVILGIPRIVLCHFFLFLYLFTVGTRIT